MWGGQVDWLGGLKDQSGEKQVPREREEVWGAWEAGTDVQRRAFSLEKRSGD